MSDESEISSKAHEAYIKGIDGYRKFALSIPALCVSLSSALLAFEIYYLTYFYKPKPGFFAEDVIVALPMIGGSLFLVAAALALDWVVDSMSAFESKTLVSMYTTEAAPSYEHGNGFLFRATLFSGAYVIFASCVSLLLFLLVAAIPIFLQDDDLNRVARGVILFAGGYYAVLIWIKMMTNTLPRALWRWLIGGFVLFMLGNAWALLTLLRII
jgi:hypothetical protein